MAKPRLTAAEKRKRKADVERERQYRKNQASRGLKQVHLWVPEADVERTKKYVEKLRKKHIK